MRWPGCISREIPSLRLKNGAVRMTPAHRKPDSIQGAALPKTLIHRQIKGNSVVLEQAALSR